MEVDARMLRRHFNPRTVLLAVVLTGGASLAFGQEQTPATEAPAEPVPVEKPVPEENIYRTGSGETRLVRTGETLMSIAREWSTTTGTTLAQTMVSIYRSNPDAFGNGMSDMQRGAALRLPTAEQIRQVPAGEAMSEVSRQLNIWRTQVVPSQPVRSQPARSQPVQQPAPKPIVAPPAVKMTLPEASAPPATTPGESRVRLVPPVQVPASAEVTPTPEAQALLALEQRMARIEAQLAESKRLLEERSRELKQLEERAAKAESWQTTLTSLWWLSPIFIVLTLVLAAALWVRSRRFERDSEPAVSRAESTVESVKEMTFDLPPITPKAAIPDPVMPDALMRAPPRVEPAPLDPLNLDPIDLEGDPPPLNEASSMIDLARAYIEMGDYRSALLELQAALKIGDEAQRTEALRLLDSLPKS